MVLPLVPLAAGAVAGIGGAVAGSVLGGSKKEETINHPYAYYAPVQQYSPTVQYAPTTGYSYVGSTYVIESPAAMVSPSATASPTGAPTQTAYPAQSQTSGGGVDWTTIGVVGIAAVVGIALLTAPKRRRR